MGSQTENFFRHGTEDERIRVSADDVLNAIAEGCNIDIEYAVISGELDIAMISDRLESGEDEVWQVKGDIKISNSEISGNMDFSLAAFCGRVSFLSCVFKEHAHFSAVSFYEEADFSSSTFNRELNFSSADFDKKGGFSSVTFNGSASFLSVNFFSAAIFSSATFNGTANFFGSVFDTSVSFWLSSFSKSVLFWEVTFNGEADFTGTAMRQPASFMDVKIRENTVPLGLWNEIVCPTVRFLTVGKVTLTRKLVTDFSSLDTATIMKGSSNPYLKRYIDDEQWIKSWRHKGGWREFAFFIWELTSHCGRSIGLWAAWSFLLIILFTLAYTPAPGWMPDWWCDFWYEYGATFEQTVLSYSDKPMNFWSSFYFSIVSFTTLGFGDVAAANSLARFLVTIQVAFGYVMLGGLISIFANKFARRS